MGGVDKGRERKKDKVSHLLLLQPPLHRLRYPALDRQHKNGRQFTTNCKRMARHERGRMVRNPPSTTAGRSQISRRPHNPLRQAGQYPAEIPPRHVKSRELHAHNSHLTTNLFPPPNHGNLSARYA